MTVRLAVCALIGYPSRGKATQDDKALNGAGLDEYDLEKMYVYMCVCVCVCVCVEEGGKLHLLYCTVICPE